MPHVCAIRTLVTEVSLQPPREKQINGKEETHGQSSSGPLSFLHSAFTPSLPPASILHFLTSCGNGLPHVALTSLDLTLRLTGLDLGRISRPNPGRPCFAQEVGLETEFCDCDFPKLLPLTGPLDRSQDSATLRVFCLWTGASALPPSGVFCLPQFSGPSMHNLSSRT